MACHQAPDSPEYYTVPCSAPDTSPRPTPPTTTTAPSLPHEASPDLGRPNLRTPPSSINPQEMTMPDPQQTFSHDRDESGRITQVTIVRVVHEHTHPLTRSVPVVQNMECHKNRDGSIMELVDTMQTASVRPSIVRNMLSEIHGGEHLVPLTSRDLQSRWHILRKHHEALNALDANYEGLREDLESAINHPLTVDEFESCWAAMLDKYLLHENHTLAALYDLRTK
ncbi:hypothetical protein PR202_ga20536 [Eleusine coracana subsp. coracana]|uniref:Protein FAR1-RELATED SEQUENCE n=1 Tax=Eleusine coracana subsp. coracana TaxID=191504 RepID=A0AAV5CZ02_ELECO|nr:hypothetical protein PR202_ga20536 [Eleusine coracana subsp. coracana]